jgi:hypothetical protein
LLAAALLSWSAPSLAAGPTPEQIATARELYKQGADALDALDAKTAVEKLVAAWALVQTPVIGFDLARAQMAVGHLVEAREAALAVSRLPAVPTETARSTQARTQSQEMADAIAPRIAHLTVKVTGLAPDQDAVIKLDGAIVPREALTVAHQVNPGAHTATIILPDGQKREETITLAEGAKSELVLETPTPLPPTEKPPPLVIAPTTTTAPPPEKQRPISPIVWIGVGVTGAGLAIGAIAGAFALSEAGAVRDRCTLVIGLDHVCSQADAGHLSSASTSATISTVGFIGAGIGVGIIVTGLILTVTHTSKSARLTPFGVAGTF